MRVARTVKPTMPSSSTSTLCIYTYELYTAGSCRVQLVTSIFLFKLTSWKSSRSSTSWTKPAAPHARHRHRWRMDQMICSSCMCTLAQMATTMLAGWWWWSYFSRWLIPMFRSDLIDIGLHVFYVVLCWKTTTHVTKAGITQLPFRFYGSLGGPGLSIFAYCIKAKLCCSWKHQNVEGIFWVSSQLSFTWMWQNLFNPNQNTELVHVSTLHPSTFIIRDFSLQDFGESLGSLAVVWNGWFAARLKEAILKQAAFWWLRNDLHPKDLCNKLHADSQRRRDKRGTKTFTNLVCGIWYIWYMGLYGIYVIYIMRMFSSFPWS